MTVRLNKLLAERGLGARRKCDELIQSGVVRVNGRVETEPGTQIEPGKDKVEVNGRPLPKPQRLAYYVLHKPVGVISTLSDPEGRPTVRELLPPGSRLFPVGRLDADTSGVLLLTNDGELAHHLMHPRYGVSKSYRVHADRVPSPAMLKRLQEGIEFEPGVVSAPAQVRVLDHTPGDSVLEISIHEGRYRQVRRMCEAAGIQVHRLHRWAYGPLKLKDLPRGLYRELSEAEVGALRASSARPMRGGTVPHRPRGLRRGRDPGAPADPRERAPRSYRGDAPPAGARPKFERGSRPERREGEEGGRERPRPEGRPSYRNYSSEGMRGESPRPRRTDERPVRERGERSGPVRERRPFSERSEGDRPRREAGERPPFRKRTEGESPRRTEGRPPFRERTEGERPRRGTGERPPFRERSGASERPRRGDERRPFRERGGEGDRPQRPRFGDRPARRESPGGFRRDRGDAGPRRTGERPFRSDRPGAARPFRGGSAPFRDRSGTGPKGRFGRPAADRGDRPARGGFSRDRSERPARGSFTRDRSARPERGGFTRGPRADRGARPERGGFTRGPRAERGARPERGGFTRGPRADRGARPERGGFTRGPRADRGARPERGPGARRDRPYGTGPSGGFRGGPSRGESPRRSGPSGSSRPRGNARRPRREG